MARERCAGCFGSGKGIDFKGVCTFCGGNGTIWVPDKTDPGPVGGHGRSAGGSGGSTFSSIEELLATLLAIAAFGYLAYYGFSEEWEWYWPLIIGAIAAVVTYFVFMGPLRFVLVLAKWAIYIGLIVLFLWGVYKIWLSFSSS